VKETAEAIARLRNCSLEELSEETCSAARNFFRGLA
jgi:Tat protein secretion system quality control protein TatD with DNase activity